MNQFWYQIPNADEVASPALLVNADRAERNIRRAIEIVGDTARLRPHVKTHKLAEIVRMHLAAGVTKFKCATIAEAEMTAAAGARDVLLGYQPVGPNVLRVIALTRKFPQTRFSVVADDAASIDALAKAFAAAKLTLDVFLDIDCGQHRTGVPAGDEAAALYRRIASSTGLRAAGLHAYEGHIHDSDVETRRRKADEAFAPVATLKKQLEANDLNVPTIVAGGTPTFPMHAARTGVECSPGTYVFWDFGYAETMPDLPFEVAAVLLTRVVSKPSANRLCLDLGHKAVASESPHPRVKFLNLPEATAVMHSEEHLVVETPRANESRVGDVLYGVPRHICPTVALHGEVVVVGNARAGERWKVVARDRVLTI
jgi:D-serine deaminase-like pyridoxal phosphate-dependent protein